MIIITFRILGKSVFKIDVVFFFQVRIHTLFPSLLQRHFFFSFCFHTLELSSVEGSGTSEAQKIFSRIDRHDISGSLLISSSLANNKCNQFKGVCFTDQVSSYMTIINKQRETECFVLILYNTTNKYTTTIINKIDF